MLFNLHYCFLCKSIRLRIAGIKGWFGHYSQHIHVIVFQLKRQFQPSSMGGPSTSATSGSAPQSAGQPLSYAQYIVQSKVSSNPHTERTTKPVQCVGAGADTVKQAANTQYLQSGAGAGASVSQGCVTPQVSAGGTGSGESAPLAGEKREEAEMTGADQIQTEGQRSEPGLNLGPKPVGSGSSIIVSPRQVCTTVGAFCCLTQATAGLAFCMKLARLFSNFLVTMCCLPFRGEIPS